MSDVKISKKLSAAVGAALGALFMWMITQASPVIAAAPVLRLMAFGAIFAGVGAAVGFVAAALSNIGAFASEDGWASDDDQGRMSRVNIDGSPMVGHTDINGSPYGVTSSSD